MGNPGHQLSHFTAALVGGKTLEFSISLSLVVFVAFPTLGKVDMKNCFRAAELQSCKDETHIFNKAEAR